jgi:hypothetical protein
MVLTLPRSPRNQRRALITGLTAGTVRGLSVPEELARPAPRDHASFSARRRITANKRAFKQIPRNAERIIPVSVRHTVPAGPTYREPQPIRDIYRVGEIFLRRLAPGARTPGDAQSQPRPERCCRLAVRDQHDGHRRPIRVLHCLIPSTDGGDRRSVTRHTLRGKDRRITHRRHSPSSGGVHHGIAQRAEHRVADGIGCPAFASRPGRRSVRLRPVTPGNARESR